MDRELGRGHSRRKKHKQATRVGRRASLWSIRDCRSKQGTGTGERLQRLTPGSASKQVG